uniref:(northern house mosquito) hypothetical protein n=1 Tax=Culex pipiens TaxID=7175 RepID=A0A8D8B3W2_CULPI
MFSQRTDSELGETLSPLRMEVTRTDHKLRRQMFSQNIPEMNPRAQKFTTNRKKKKLMEKRVRFLEHSQRYSTQPCTHTRKSPSRTVNAGANLLEKRSTGGAPGSVIRRRPPRATREQTPCVASACATYRTGSTVPPWFVEVEILSSEDTRFSSATPPGKGAVLSRSGPEWRDRERGGPIQNQADVSLLAIQKPVGAQCY